MKTNKKFCVAFATKNHYPMFEGCVYKYSKANFDDVLVLNVDIDSTDEWKKKGKETCDRLGIHYVNKDSDHYISNQRMIGAVDKYLTENNIDVDWILTFQHDTVPILPYFWEYFDSFLRKNESFLLNKVGMIGANSYQNYNRALQQVHSNDIFIKRKENTNTARGNLVNGILNPPYNGWYTKLPNDYYKVEYFVVESPNWQSVAFNRKLFRENIIVDDIFRYDLWSDDIAHQFMLKGYINIAMTNLMVCHDHALKQGIEIYTDQTFIRNQSSHDRFIQKYGWDWGYRNKQLRQHFENKLEGNWGDEPEESMYKNSVQKILFNLDINYGPIPDIIDL